MAVKFVDVVRVQMRWDFILFMYSLLTQTFGFVLVAGRWQLIGVRVQSEPQIRSRQERFQWALF